MMGRLAPVALVFLAGCGGCNVDTDPLPGSFDPAARIPRAAQVRLTNGGIDALSVAAGDWIADAARVACAGDADCPSALGATCVNSVCEAGGDRAFLAVDVPQVTAGDLEVCTTGTCRLFLHLTDLALASAPPSGLRATASVDLASTPIAVHHTPTGEDCQVTVASGSPLPLALDADLAPSAEGRISIELTAAQLPLSAGQVTGCGADVSPDLAPVIETALLPRAHDLIGRAIGEACDVSSTCPSSTTCDPGGYCADGARIVLPGLDVDQRVTIPPIIDLYATDEAMTDLSLRVGGTVDVDPAGITTGVLAGLELVTPNPRCANVLESPRLRPTFTAPPPLPASDMADLDFDGVEETPYQLAFGLSRAFLDQAVWSTYGGGLLCGAISTADYDDLHTAALEVIIPSVRFLTRSHLFPRADRPARISFWLRQEPELTIGSGETHPVPGSTDVEFTDPLLHASLRDLEINLSALVEERWVRIMTATLDLNLGIGVIVTPNGELEPVVGVGVQDVISNVRVTNSELLAESPESLEQALPTLLSFALLEFAGSAGTFPIPTIDGTDLEVLGVRGLVGPSGDHETLAVFADVGINAGGNLSLAAETRAELLEVRTPKTAAFSVTEGAVWPEVTIALSGQAPAGEALEHQVRLDGGFWTPFTREQQIRVSRPELLVQGRHRIEVRARVAGDYRTLDPTPAVLEFFIDSEPPSVTVANGEVTAFDRVSRDEITVEVLSADGARPLSLKQGRAALPEGARAVRATDQAGLVTEVDLSSDEAEGPSSTIATGCRATREGEGGLSLWLLVGLLLLKRPVRPGARNRDRTPPKT